MFPWGHAAVAYLAYSLWCRQRDTLPDGVAVLGLAVGSQTPDLIDKPLSWTLMLLPTGRSLGHSALVAAVVVAVGVVVARRVPRHRVPIFAFLFGHVSHVLVDPLDTLVNGGGVADLGFLLWPLVPQQATEYGFSILEFFLSIQPTPWILFELFVTLVGVGVWLRDGTPGVSTLAGWWSSRPGAVRRGD